MNDLAMIQPGNELAGVETASSAAAAQAKALVEARYIMAMRRPRDMDVVRERMLKECRRPAFAAVARYVKPIGQDKAKWPTGPSIRFAESAVRNMTNITVETMTVYDDREKRILKVTVTDLETNVPYSQDIVVAKTIERRKKKDGDTVISTRTNSFGDVLYILEATDDDIINKQQALISKAIRTQGLRLIPGDIVDECMDAVLETQRDADAQDPDTAKRKLFDSFSALGVRADQIKEYLGHDASTLAPKELADLRALFAAIRDGEATWRDAMDSREATVKTSNGMEAVKAAAKKPKKAAAPDPETGEIQPPENTGAPVFTYAQHADRVLKAADAEAAALALDAARGLPEDQYAELTAVYVGRWSHGKAEQ